MLKKGICKFCGEEKELIGAHIIPRNFYLDYKKVKGYRAMKPDGSWKQWQSGLLDNNILCKDCDGKIFKKFEDEAYRIISKECLNHLERRGEGVALYHYKKDEFNYDLIRKFFISVLYRASISKLDDFEGINLGKYENIAKEILEGKNNHFDLFDFFIFKFPENKLLNHTVYLQQIKFHRCISYKLVMAGYHIVIIVKNKLPKEIQNLYKMLFVNENDLYIMETEELYKQHHIKLLNIARKWTKLL